MLIGSNLAWCHPVLYKRLLAARAKRGTKIVVIDPRRTASCDQADMHLAIEPGSDVALFNRLLVSLHKGGAVAPDFLAHTNGFEAALAAAMTDSCDPIGLPQAEIDAFCQLWMATKKVVTIYSQGVNQSTSGTDKVNAILNCHLATGRIGKPGCGPLSVTGQPNAMGGREVGGLANMLACHLDLENADHRAAVQDFWGCESLPNAPGLKAVDMFKAVGDGRIKALWIIHTNPAVSLPEANAVREAIAKCDYTVVSDITAQTDTARLADVLLPATAWAEKDGTVTNSDRTISRQRAVLPPPGQSRADWRILVDVAKRMGFGAAFDYGSEAEIFREYAALSGIAGRFGRDFDISGLSEITDDAYADLTPQRWPVSETRSGGRFFADGQFYHQDSKARFLPVSCKPPATQTEPRYPFRLNTGRLRDQWHTMTRTALSPKLSAHLPEPFVDIHPQDAAALRIKSADLVQLTSRTGQGILRARITRDVKPGQLFAPMHWTGETAPSARIDTLVAAATDPISGQPESKASAVAAKRFDAAWYGFAVSQSPMIHQADYWAQARTAQGYRSELAGCAVIDDWEAEARRLFQAPSASAVTLVDPRRCSARVLLHEGGVVLAALFVAREPLAIMRDYLAAVPGTRDLLALSGRRAGDLPDPGPTLCSCLSVGVNTIINAIEAGEAMSVAAIGASLGAGTNCGSCRPEIATLLQSVLQKEAAE